jgi:hypothetical protein
MPRVFIKLAKALNPNLETQELKTQTVENRRDSQG